MELKTAIEHAIDGKCILFTGAGFSFGAENIIEKPIPAGKTLANLLTVGSRKSTLEVPLDRAANAYIKNHSPAELIDLLKSYYTVSKITAAHETVASLAWRRVYTTNYDKVYEAGRKKLKSRCESIDSSTAIDTIDLKNHLIVHINGAIDKLSEHTLLKSFKLTSASYATESFEETIWAFHLRADVRTASAIIFIGYSMYDLDIQRTLYSMNIKDKCHFIVAPQGNNDEFELSELEEFGTVHEIGVDAFASIIETVKSSYSPKQEGLLLSAWNPVNPALPDSPIRDEDIISFYTEGRTNDTHLAHCFIKSNEYCVYKSCIEKMNFSDATARTPILITGLLGTGKTFLSSYIAQQLLSLGRSVYILNKTDNDEMEELRLIINTKTEIALITENYSKHFETIKWLYDINPSNTILILTSRTDIHESNNSRFLSIYDNKHIEFDINTMNSSECYAMVDIMEHFGLWGDKAGLTHDQKNRIIQKNCNAQLPSVLLEIFKSKHIIEKFSRTIDISTNRSEIQTILICLFCLEIMEFAPRPYVIQELLGGNNINWSTIKQYAPLKSIIDFNSSIIQSRSSVLGHHLIKSLFTSKQIVSVLTKMAVRATTLSAQREYGEIMRELMRFKNITNILPDAQKLIATQNYYESIKNLESTRSNPQFWLQYAIACLTLDKLDLSQVYFDTAYGLAKYKPHYRLHQIDNHYSRFLFTKSCKTTDISEAMELTRQGIKILLNQFTSEERHYPYRVAGLLFKTYHHWKSRLKSDDTLLFDSTFKVIKDRVASADASLEKNHEFRECKRSIQEYFKL